MLGSRRVCNRTWSMFQGSLINSKTILYEPALAHVDEYNLEVEMLSVILEE